jgi:hypothetical protein
MHNSKNLSYDSDTPDSSISDLTNKNRAKKIKNNQQIKSSIDKRIRITDKICDQFQILEKILWDYNQFTQEPNRNENLNEILLKILV